MYIMVRNSDKRSYVIQTGGGGNEVAIFAATLGKWLLLHPAAKYILHKRYGIRDEGWCSFPVLRLAQQMLGECRGGSVEVAIETAQNELDELEVVASNERLDRAERGEGGEGGGKSRRPYKDRKSRKKRKSRKNRKSRKGRAT